MVPGRACELAWFVPWWRNGKLCVGVAPPHSSERSLIVHSADELVAAIRRISREVREEFGVWVAVSMEGLDDPSLDATVVGERWHFWYLADAGNVSLASVGDESEPGKTPVIFSDFETIQNAELVPDAVGEVIVRQWYAARTLSDRVRWRTR